MVRVYFLAAVDDNPAGSTGMIERTLATRLIQSGKVEAYSDYVERQRIDNGKKEPEVQTNADQSERKKRKTRKLKKERTKKKGLEKAVQD